MDIRNSVFICLLLTNLTALPLTTGLSYLHNPTTGKKVVILYDTHLAQMARSQLQGAPAMTDVEPILLSQKKELENLVTTLSQQKEETLFLSECNNLGFGSIALGYKDNLHDTLSVVPKIFIKTENYTGKLGSITFDPADPRSPIDTFAATNFVVYNESLLKELDNGTLESYLCKMTIGCYCNHIKELKDRLLKHVSNLPIANETIKEKVKISIERAYNKLNHALDEKTKKHSLKNTDHLLRLYAAELKENNYHLMIRAVDFGCTYFDIELLFCAQASQVKNIIVQAGGLHAKLLEHRLVQQGYTLVETHGNTQDFVLKENDYVQPLLPLDDNGKMQVNSVDHIDTLVSRYLK